MIIRWWRTALFATVSLLFSAVTSGCVRFAPPAPASAESDPCAPTGEDTGPPELIAIDHDDFQARHIGRTADGRQFFLTRPFEIGHGREFVALYLFGTDGTFAEARIDAFGPGDGGAADRTYRSRLKELGDVTYGRISVAPFGVEKFGTTFGLITDEPEDDADLWWVTAEPGDYMAFTAPWDCGLYDT